MRVHNPWLITIEHLLDIFNDITRIMGVNRSRVTSTNTVGAVDEDHGYDWHVVIGLNRNSVIIQIVQEVIVIWMENDPAYSHICSIVGEN